jgi:coenzyme F420 biosynthesis associated uncharacterized protein
MSEQERDPSLVDWGLAERLAVTIATSGPETAPVRQPEVTRAAERAAGLVRDYTRLEPLSELPRAEAIDRRGWVRANVAAFRGMSGGVERRLVEGLRMPEPLRGITRRLAGSVGGVEVGLALGYVGRKVLGQYDLALIGPARPPRLLFVGPNIAEAHARLGGDREVFLHWISLHEATHAFQFASVPWLQEHLGDMVEELLDGAALGASLAELLEKMRHLLRNPDPRRLADPLREGGLVRLLAGPREADLLRRLEAAMAVVEGYAEHVMDAIGAGLGPAYARLRAGVEEERQRRGTLDVLVGRLLGLDLKLRQYRLGKRFADFVVERSGIEGLNRVWASSEALPSPPELDRPERWMDRVGASVARM